MERLLKLRSAQALVVVIVLSVFIGGQAGAKKQRNATRLAALESQVESLALDLAASNERVAALEGITQLLDQDGTYYGFVNAAQVWSHHCESGASAAWEELAGYAELSCEGVEIAGRKATSMRKIVKSGSPIPRRHGNKEP